ncbi:serine cycle enzyme [Deinococcus piscis]|uniref:Serine cycle enzyme n=1 Tax=Deinococcus piscis TaxID=394230 RepID=A0ABQ3K6W0_9DEIO|nr:cyclodeaminase/cyclohydrolase family protein [Deinococcus piscis]GHG04643.1 serine cycle enzyme [Deinococcus piscis]
MNAEATATPSLWDHTMQQVLDAAGARRSVPTGGSVIAVSGAFGVSLLVLAVNLTLTKKDPPAELTTLHDTLRLLQRRIQALGDEDAELFAAFMKEARQQDVAAEQTEALRQQTREVPLQLARELQEGLRLAQQLRPLVHTSVVSDVQAGAAILHGAGQASLFTLAHNFSSLEEGQGEEFRQQWEQLCQEQRLAQEWLTAEAELR